ncbi:MAG: hypothetical protein CTY39_01430 [Hyphomicrobium sp.]|nr:MAG: hypothetical protein CTY39_01430 [Hyphomicrobium sp.]
MARAGILYSSVAHAAAQLSAAGKNPTVDAVRDALGGTGSKSTIAPMLKRWKAEHQDQIIAQDAGLPASLVQAVKGVYDQLQHEADEKITAIRTAAAADNQALATQLDAAHELNLALTKERDALAEALAREKAERARLDSTLHQLELTHTKAEAKLVGLTERLADRQNEIDGLHRQLDQARTQFEHYQESIALQRANERQQAEQERLRLENELIDARHTVGALNTALGQRDVELTHVRQDKERVTAEIAALQNAYGALQTERRAQEQQIQMATALQQESRSQIDTLSGALAQAKSELATLSSEKTHLQGHIVLSESKVQSLLDENKLLIIHKARLEGVVSQLPTHTASAT